jgi:hypothetical protein
MAPTTLAAATHLTLPWWWPCVVIGGVLLAAAVYLLACWIWPFAACQRCDGLGRFHSPSGKAWRRCRRCKGTGERLRTGHRVVNAIRRAYQ